VYHASDEGHAACLGVIERLVDAKRLAAECTRCLPVQLHWAHSRGVPWLLAHGGDPNVVHPRYGQNALHAAVARGAGEAVVKLLLAHGADPHVKDKAGRTAVQIAKARKRPAIAKLLVSPNGSGFKR
jgi:hypothetical protein